MPDAAGRFPQISGMSFQVDLSRPVGQRVVSIRIGNAPLDDDKMYRLATIDFLARGNDGYTMFRDAKATAALFGWADDGKRGDGVSEENRNGKKTESRAVSCSTRKARCCTVRRLGHCRI